MPRLAALAQVGLRNVLPVNAHAVDMLPGTNGGQDGISNNIWGAMSESWVGGVGQSPALVAADHVAVVVGETANAPGDVGAVAAVL